MKDSRIHAQQGPGDYSHSQFAPCGVRISGPEPERLHSSTDDLPKVTCGECQKTIVRMVKAYRAAKERAKKAGKVLNWSWF
jgi:hypothetical protein